MLLPDSLQPWRPWLDWFSPTLAPHIGELLRRLQPLLGSFRGRQQGGQPEPDGLDDLRRRGPYERLLGSEWLLADELPDEFLRRAAQGEHLFLTPRPRAKQSQRLIIALFDAGPLQLGAPRLAHIALWILLARRAKEAGGELRWAILQERSAWQEASEAVHLQRLLKARCLEMADATHWQNWQEAIAETRQAHSEFWMIGSDPNRLTATIPHLPSHVVTLRGSLTGDALEVAITEGGKHRNIELPLPPGAIAERLLKGRFIEAAGPHIHRKNSNQFALTLPPIIAANGNYVAVLLEHSLQLQIFRIPKVKGSDNKSKPNLVQLPKDTRPLTMAFHGKTLGALLAAGDQLQFWQIGLSPTERPPHEKFRAADSRANWLSSVWLRADNASHFYVLDEARHLTVWRNKAMDKDATFESIERSALGLAAAGHNAIVYAALSFGQLVIHFLNGVRHQTWEFPFQTPPPKSATVYFAGGERWHYQCCACAIHMSTNESGGENWCIFHSYRRNPSNYHETIRDVISLNLPADHRGVGLVPHAENDTYALVALSADGKELLLYLHGDKCTVVHATPSPIVILKVDGSSGLVAMLTEDRQLIVYSTLDASLRMFVHSKKVADVNE